MRLEQVSLTVSGRPVLFNGEVERALLDKVDLEFERTGGVANAISDRYKDGYTILTTHRVLWIQAQPVQQASQSCSLPLSSLLTCKKESYLSGFKYKTRIHLQTRHTANGAFAADGEPHVGVQSLFLHCHLSPDAFIQALDDVLRTKPWRTTPSSRQNAASTPATSGGASGPPAQNPPAPPSRALHQPPPPPGQYGHHYPSHSQPPAALNPPSSTPPQGPQYSALHLQQLTDMGFPRNRCIRALLASNNAGVQAAMDWILAFGDQPGMDDPIDPPVASAVPPSQHNIPPPPPNSMCYDPPNDYSSSTQSSYKPYPSYSLPAGAKPHQDILVGYGSFGNQPPAQPSLAPWSSSGSGSIPSPPFMGSFTSSQVSSHSDATPNPLWGMQSHPPPPPPSYPYNPGAPHHGPYSVAHSHSQYPTPPHPHGPPPPPAQVRPSSQQPPPRPSNVGVAGILSREQEKLAGTGRSLEQAFSDLRALMAMAGEMVKLAEKFRGVMGKVGAGEDGDDLVDVDTQLQLSSMGIVSPVTKETAGSRYQIELSKQLADFLEKPLANAHGMMTLPDVYCIFNRARGTELVSPDDLLEAIHLFGKLGLPMRLRKFPSGVVVVQSSAHSDEEICLCLGKLVEGPGCGKALVASDVASTLDVPLHIAHEHLLTAEARGVLCRDDAPEGIRFFRNFFMEVSC